MLSMTFREASGGSSFLAQLPPGPFELTRANSIKMGNSLLFYFIQSICKYLPILFLANYVTLFVSLPTSN
jgi:hypothetical protein